MNISWYQKRFGVGFTGFAWSLVLFLLLWLLDRSMGHPELAGNPQLSKFAGCCLIGIWVFWYAWCMKTIRAWWDHSRLCTNGPYRYVRHPVYAGGIFLGGIGTVLLFNSWILFLWPIAVYPVWSRLVRKEEKMMLSVFDDAYRRYMKCTGRLLPKLFK